MFITKVCISNCTSIFNMQDAICWNALRQNSDPNADAENNFLMIFFYVNFKINYLIWGKKKWKQNYYLKKIIMEKDTCMSQWVGFIFIFTIFIWFDWWQALLSPTKKGWNRVKRKSLRWKSGGYKTMSSGKVQHFYVFYFACFYQ